MEKIYFKSILEKVKVFLKHFMFYVVFVLSLIAGFSVGYHYKTLVSLTKNNISKPEVVLKEDISLAIDETNNLLVINKKDGTYILYEDSVGRTIFNLYAKNIWGEHK